MSKNNGGPAFPGEFVEQRYVERSGGVCSKGYEDFTVKTPGMTLRDYFAAKVLPAVYADYCDSAQKIGFDEQWQVGVALDAYAMADAMLAARDQ